MTELFSQHLSDAIEQEIDRYFAIACQEAEDIDSSYGQLWASLHTLIKSGGKRFRPNMVVLAYELFGGTAPHTIIPIAAAHELLHFSLLIHDDIIDRDDVRYGVPNITGRYKAFYQKHIHPQDELAHFANSAAILAGDLMLSGAHQLIMSSSATAAQKQTAHALLSRSIFDVAGGELLDTEASILDHNSGKALHVALYKTARYSFVAPLVTGAKLAHLNSHQETQLRAYAEALGVAYQLVDDLLGVFGSEQQTGKSTSSDIREGKRTFMVEHAMGTMSTGDKILFNLAFGNQNATPEAVHQAKELITANGGKTETKKAIARHQQRALRAAGQLSLDTGAIRKLNDLVDHVIERAA